MLVDQRKNQYDGDKKKDVWSPIMSRANHKISHWKFLRGCPPHAYEHCYGDVNTSVYSSVRA